MRKAPITTPVVDPGEHYLTPPWQRFFGIDDTGHAHKNRYVVVFANMGTPVIGNPVTHYTIKRRSALKSITITAYVPPSGGVAEWKVYYDGTLVNQDPLVIPASHPSLVPVVFTDMAKLTYNTDKVITLEVVSVNGLANVTVELLLEEID